MCIHRMCHAVSIFLFSKPKKQPFFQDHIVGNFVQTIYVTQSKSSLKCRNIFKPRIVYKNTIYWPFLAFFALLPSFSWTSINFCSSSIFFSFWASSLDFPEAFLAKNEKFNICIVFIIVRAQLYLYVGQIKN